MFIQEHPTTKADSIGALWLKVKKVKIHIESKEKPTYPSTKLTNYNFRKT